MDHVGDPGAIGRESDNWLVVQSEFTEVVLIRLHVQFGRTHRLELFRLGAGGVGQRKTTVDSSKSVLGPREFNSREAEQQLRPIGRPGEWVLMIR